MRMLLHSFACVVVSRTRHGSIHIDDVTRTPGLTYTRSTSPSSRIHPISVLSLYVDSIKVLLHILFRPYSRRRRKKLSKNGPAIRSLSLQLFIHPSGPSDRKAGLPRFRATLLALKHYTRVSFFTGLSPCPGEIILCGLIFFFFVLVLV